MKTSDEKIVALQLKIAEQKKDISDCRFAPITSCILGLDGINVNLNTLGLDSLKILLVKVHSLRLSAESLGYEEILYSGYTLNAWSLDINNRINHLGVKQKQSDLRDLENRLNELLSSDKKLELELSQIEGMLK